MKVNYSLILGVSAVLVLITGLVFQLITGTVTSPAEADPVQLKPFWTGVSIASFFGILALGFRFIYRKIETPNWLPLLHAVLTYGPILILAGMALVNSRKTSTGTIDDMIDFLGIFMVLALGFLLGQLLFLIYLIKAGLKQSAQ